MGRTFKIGEREVGAGHPPFIIAEMSGNHNRSLERALEIVEAAAAAGAHAVKLQTYTPDTMTINIRKGEFVVNDPRSVWNGMSLYDLYGQAYTPWEWHMEIFDRCKKLGLACFSTPYDATAVDFLESLGNPAYKIASFENTDLPLIKRAASCGKPMIISAGMATQEELWEAVNAARSVGCSDIAILKCTSSYPSLPDDSDLLTIPDIADRFDCVAGLSDHTMGMGAALASIALGSAIIEKHFTLSRADGGVDSVFSMEPAELAALVSEAKNGWRALGKVSYGPKAGERPSLTFRRSLYFIESIKGGTINAGNMRAIRPGLGLPPKYFDELIGRKVSADVERGMPVSWDIIEKGGK